jgi:carbamoyltransferase
MYILGISCYYHDSSACLLKDGVVVAAAQEERFNRDKYSPVFPIQSINYCLQHEGITSLDLDYITFYEKMYLKFERTILSHLIGFPFTYKNFIETMPLWLRDRLLVPLKIREELSYKKDIFFPNHHTSHAASSFFSSNFKEAAIITIDGVGEYASTTFGVGKDLDIEIKKVINYPHSLGLFYSIVTSFLGFRVFTGEGKVMALAEFGDPIYAEQFREMMIVRDDGSFNLNLKFFSFNRGERMYSNEFVQLLGEPRKEDTEISKRHMDIAASLQKITEEVVIKIAKHVYSITKSKNLCLAGGVFLNVTANSRILNETDFENVYIQPAAGDAGSCIGSALFLYHTILRNKRINQPEIISVGPSYSNNQIEILLKNKKLKYKKFESEEDLLDQVAGLLSKEQVVAWFQGRMEFGPRALGNRSILADPRSSKMKDWINFEIKNREFFRPFGASVLREKVSDYFEFNSDSPYMLYVANFKDNYSEKLPAIKHINGTSRIQTVTENSNKRYYKLIKKFGELTGVSLLLNTSLNDSEPIVCTPQQAIDLFIQSKITVMAIEDFLVEK